MAVAGGAKPSVLMQIKDGELVMGKVAMRQGVTRDIDMAVHDLLQGRPVFVQQFSDIPDRVRRSVEMALRSATVVDDGGEQQP